MKKIILFCDGGLGNRANVLIGGLLLAKHLKRQVIVNWPINNWCGCAFSKLFINDNLQVSTKDINTLFLDNIDNAFLIHVNQTSLLLQKQYNSSLLTLKEIEQIDDNTIVYYHNRIPSYFTETEILTQLQELKVHPSILNTVAEFCNFNKVNDDTIGIHLRRTDAFTPPTNEQVQSLITSRNDLKFYICSDDPDTESILTKNDNVITYTKTQYVKKFTDGNWNSSIIDKEYRQSNYNVDRPEESVVQAFIDLLILAKTNIQFPSKSTFLKLAMLYNKLNKISI